MTVQAEYLIQDEGARRARPGRLGARVLASRARLRGLRRAALARPRGLVELVERCCARAARFAERSPSPGPEVLNEVVLNQVLFRFESDERTDETLAPVQEGGDVWMSGTTWDGRKAIRLSVSNWQTGDEETDLAVEAFRAAYGGHVPAR